MNNTALIRVLGVLGLAYIAAIVGALTYYHGDMVIALSALSAAFGVIVSALLSLRNAGAIQDVHERINGRLDHLLDAARREGGVAERKRADDEAAQR